MAGVVDPPIGAITARISPGLPSHSSFGSDLEFRRAANAEAPGTFLVTWPEGRLPRSASSIRRTSPPPPRQVLVADRSATNPGSRRRTEEVRSTRRRTGALTSVALPPRSPCLVRVLRVQDVLTYPRIDSES